LPQTTLIKAPGVAPRLAQGGCNDFNQEKQWERNLIDLRENAGIKWPTSETALDSA